jgi:hypothetical protein
MEGSNETLIEPNQVESFTNQGGSYKQGRGRGGYYKKVLENNKINKILF